VFSPNLVPPRKVIRDNSLIESPNYRSKSVDDHLSSPRLEPVCSVAQLYERERRQSKNHKVTNWFENDHQDDLELALFRQESDRKEKFNLSQ